MNYEKTVKEIARKSIKNIVMLARSKSISIESKISEALINIEISHKEFMTAVNEEKNINN